MTDEQVTIGMLLIGAITLTRAVLLFVTQCIGAIIAAYIVKALFPGELAVNTTLGTTVSIAQGVIIEMILTAMLVFTIFMLAAEKHTGNFIAPVGIGLALFIAELTGKFILLAIKRLMTGVFWTGGSLNPARSLGPAVAIHSFPNYHWIYWVGPMAGSIFAVLLFKLIKGLQYDSANTDPELGPTGDTGVRGKEDIEKSKETNGITNGLGSGAVEG